MGPDGNKRSLELTDIHPAANWKKVMIQQNRGFTLVELMVAMALTGLTMVAIFKTFSAQEKVFSVQDNAASMQQDLRAAIEVMSKDLRRVGYSSKPEHKSEPTAGIVMADASIFAFTADLDGDDVIDANDAGDVDDVITYSLSGDIAPFRLIRTRNGVDQPVADNIDALNFVYVLSAGAPTSAPADLTTIRAIQVTVVARADRFDKEYVNKSLYWNQAGPQPAPPAAPDPSLSLLGAAPNDRFRRRMLTTTIRCPNL